MKKLNLKIASVILKDTYKAYGKNITLEQASCYLKANGKTDTGYYEALQAEQDQLKREG